MEEQTHARASDGHTLADPAHEEVVDNAAVELPLGVRVAAAWSWRLILIGIAVAAFVWLIAQVAIIVIPVVIALLLSALLYPIVHAFQHRGYPRWLGVTAAMLAFLLAVTGLIWLIVSQFRAGFGDVARKAMVSWQDILGWLETTFGLSADQLNAAVEQVFETIKDNQGQIWSGALSVTTTFTQVLAGALLTLFSLIFLLIDGKRIWFWVLGFFPKRAHAPIDAAGKNGWVSVGQYVRVQVLVAFIDAVGIGVGAAVLGVPLPIPIAILVFMGSFIPFLGAISTGAIAVFIALVYNGPINALLMLSVVILVNQIEGHVLQPLVMGSAVKVHPLGVVLAVSAGALLAGIPGALFAVPLTAAASAMVNTLVEKNWDPGQDPVADYHKKNRVHREAKTRARMNARTNRGGEGE
ncbi:AI-2E family transporter [Leucobacter sp. UT-8R-CII-1-4]|uniref:AI-2E family transporter n=1 Tax=Leucobacter sp. UT-8R-CII-1-4 TaxID=3040075 RepID=UPI0024A990A6|nr:AI-2E family transporter [Leucobacter sp. UT-8R-CII-1-4]MDI6023966.1 AI-2E family transporter [Leucobacter sp. UT-8R-CII-1-4]